jgi:hypothetical protein
VRASGAVRGTSFFLARIQLAGARVALSGGMRFCCPMGFMMACRPALTAILAKFSTISGVLDLPADSAEGRYARGHCDGIFQA